MRYPADPPNLEIVAVMGAAGDDAHGRRLRGLIVVLRRTGLRIQEALALSEADLDQRRGALLVRRGKGGRRRQVGMDAYGQSGTSTGRPGQSHDSPSSANEMEEPDMSTMEQSASTADQAQAPGIDRTDLQHYDLSAPGRTMIQNRVVIRPEAQPIRHKHPGEEIIYILDGSLEYQLDGREPRTYRAGKALTVPAETVQAVHGDGTELATYVVEEGKPFIVLAD